MLTSLTYSLILIYCILIRCFTFAKYGLGIIEYDPFFNVKCFDYIKENGIAQFFDWFDNTAWYPYGREIGKSSYPGLMIITYYIHNFLESIHICIPTNTLCAIVPTVFYFILLVAIFLICRLNNNSHLSLSALAISCSIPGTIHKTSLGCFDYECIGIGIIMLIIYFYSQAVDKLNYMYSLVAALLTGFLGLTWGGHAFLINLIPLVTLFIILLEEFSCMLCVIYNVWFIFSYLILSNIPCVNELVVHSITYYFGFFVSIISFVVLFYKQIDKNKRIYISTVFLALVIIFLTTSNVISFDSITSRVFDILFSKDRKKLVSSIVEHVPSTWANYITNCGLVLLISPIGFYEMFTQPRNTMRLSIMIGYISTLILSALMSRIIVIFIPFQIITCGYALDSFLKISFRKKQYIILFSLLLICVISVNMSVVLAANKFSDNFLNFEIEGNNGIITSDDHMEMYSWLQSNAPNKIILAMWDVGYQLSKIGNVWTLNDGNTNNITQVSVVGLAFASNEKTSWEISRSYDCDYIIVSFGGASGYPLDDIMKFQWMIDTVDQHFSNISSSSYLRDDQAFIVGKHMTKDMVQSSLFKLSYNNFKYFQITKNKEKGFDAMRGDRIGHLDFKLEKYKEVYSTKNWILRIYQVAHDPLWNI